MTALSFSEQFREGNTSYVSPTKLGNLLEMCIRDRYRRAVSGSEKLNTSAIFACAASSARRPVRSSNVSKKALRQ